MGDTVNLAARVMANAQPGAVLATPAVLRRVRDDFERTPVTPFKAKGKSAPVRAEACQPRQVNATQVFVPRLGQLAERPSGERLAR